MNNEQVEIKKEKETMDKGQKKIMIAIGSLALALAIMGVILIAVL